MKPWVAAVLLSQLSCTPAPNPPDRRSRSQELVPSGAVPEPAEGFPSEGVPSEQQTRSSAPEGLECLQRHYGGAISQEAGGLWMLSFSPEQRFVYDDGASKNLDEQLDDPDLQDTLGLYLRGNSPSLPDSRSDTGRSRHVGLLAAVYGESEAEVRQHTVTIDFLGNELVVHEKISVPFARVAERIAALLVFRKDLREHFVNLGGGFRWRTIEGTDRPSAHSFGIAVDLNPKRAAYWRWNSRWDGEYPPAIVQAFEAEGFIWGGNWRHFDSMHFEYRPELLDERCRPARDTSGHLDPKGGGLRNRSKLGLPRH